MKQRYLVFEVHPGSEGEPTHLGEVTFQAECTHIELGGRRYRIVGTAALSPAAVKGCVYVERDEWN